MSISCLVYTVKYAVLIAEEIKSLYLLFYARFLEVLSLVFHPLGHSLLVSVGNNDLREVSFPNGTVMRTYKGVLLDSVK